VSYKRGLGDELSENVYQKACLFSVEVASLSAIRGHALCTLGLQNFERCVTLEHPGATVSTSGSYFLAACDRLTIG
jgi:hypothetical protein